MSNGFLPETTDWKKAHTEACVATIMGVAWRDCLDAPYEPRDYRKHGHIRLMIQVMILAMEINMSPEEVGKRWKEIYYERLEASKVMEGKPQGETRDNKGVKVGSGGTNRNKIRYPKLNKSKKVWAMFYKMFPWAARYDNWDGEKSDRYPRKNKKKNR
jgi:hypothetical protein